jgi:hypothetical protein
MGGIVGNDFGNEFGFNFGDDDEFGDDDYGDDVGFGGPAVRPSPQSLAKAWQKQNAARAHHSKRISKLDPNMHSPTKIERYSFSLSQDLVLGTATVLNTNMSGSPDTTFRPQVITVNAPTPGFVYFTGIRMANVNVTVGPGSEDGFNYSAYSWGKSMDMPTLTPANRATVTGASSTFVPPGYVSGNTFTLSVNFKGPSLLAGGGPIGI